MRTTRVQTIGREFLANLGLGLELRAEHERWWAGDRYPASASISQATTSAASAAA